MQEKIKDDMISRQMAMEMKFSHGINEDGRLYVPFSEVIKGLKNLPAVQPGPEEFEWCHDCKEYDQNSHCCHRWTKVIRQTVEELKETQPERKTGKWIRNDNGTWSCDQCNSWIPDEQHHYARFCLYCGAKMEVEE